MHLSWHGLNCVRLQTRETTILLDPLPTTVGLPSPRLQADVFVFSEAGNPQRKKVRGGTAFVIDAPGEYETRGIMIHGVATKDSSLTLYTIESEGMLVGHLSSLATSLNGPQIELLKDVDVLLVPVGGKPVLNAQQASEVISLLEPRVVIPLYYKVPSLTVRLEGVEPFLREMGVKNAAPQERIRLIKKDLPEEEMNVLVLKT